MANHILLTGACLHHHLESKHVDSKRFDVYQLHVYRLKFLVGPLNQRT